MKVVILAGGLGTRLSEHTKFIPKPMIKIGKFPILIHIIRHYLKYGLNEFIVAAGYKAEILKKYFPKFKKYGLNFEHNVKGKKCIINIIHTGKNTMTGGRIKRLQYLFNPGDQFMFTYGDGIANVNLKKLLQFHEKKRKIITITAVRPPARFGEIIIKNDLAISFKEKPQVNNSWINGGFFVANYSFFNFIKNDKDILEKSPLEKLCKIRELSVFQHKGFWKCMDTIRDKVVLTKILKGRDFFQ